MREPGETVPKSVRVSREACCLPPFVRGPLEGEDLVLFTSYPLHQTHSLAQSRCSSNIMDVAGWVEGRERGKEGGRKNDGWIC